jgi:maleylacetoacetate isomerase/maleylpyruvate isomerase
MKLYSYFRSSAAFRVRIALNLKGIAYDIIPINLLKDEQAGAAYSAVNPQQRVPALDTGGTVLIQSPAILEYLDEVYPEPPLLPMGALQRARIREVAAIIACDIHPLNNLGPLRYLKRELGHDQAQIDEWYAHWIREGFDAVERRLEPGPYAFGSRPGLADIHLVPQIYNARRLNVPLDRYPRIVSVGSACDKLDAFRKAAPENQPDAA